MPLLNYTTTVSENKTASEIEKILAAHKAKAILKEYDDNGFVVALAFKVAGPNNDIPIRLPIDVEATLTVMKRAWNSGKMPYRFANEAQARRVAWRIVKDWVEAQMAILETEMVRMEQIFLPYIVTEDGRTVYQRLVESKFKLLIGES